MSQWKIISRKSVFKAKLFEVREIIFKNKNGQEKVHHVAKEIP